MRLLIRPMREDEAEAVAQMVRSLAADTGSSVVPELTGGMLAAAGDLIDVVVAEDDGRLAGACLGLMTFSTWRGAPGLYVVDLFVLPEARGRNVGVELLRSLAMRFAARGAQFIKLEVDQIQHRGGALLRQAGFHQEDGRQAPHSGAG